MVQDTISNAIMLIAAIVAVTIVLNAVYPAMSDAVGSVRSATGDADRRSRTAVTITAYNYSPDYRQMSIWMKNSGAADIADPDDIRVYYGNDSGAMKGYDIYACQLFSPDLSKAAWGPGETCLITFGETPLAPLPHEPGLHRVKVVLPGGATSETIITI